MSKGCPASKHVLIDTEHGIVIDVQHKHLHNHEAPKGGLKEPRGRKRKKLPIPPDVTVTATEFHVNGGRSQQI